MNDQSETEKLEIRLKKTVTKLHELSIHVGSARQVIEFSSDQRKNALASEAKRFIERGEGAANSEQLARSSPIYLEKINTLGDQLADAYRVKATWEATMCEFEACRSLLAMTRETLKTLEG